MFCHVFFCRAACACVRACVRAKRFHLSDHHWKQALVALVPTRNCPASCPHAYLSRIESSRANGVQRQRRRTPVHVEGGPTGWAAPAAQSDCAHGCTIARLVPARDHPQTRIWSGTAHSVRILDAPGSQTDEFNEKLNGPQRFPLVLWNTRPPSEPGTCMDGSEIGPGGAQGEEVWAEPSGGGAVRVGVLRLT